MKGRHPSRGDRTSRALRYRPPSQPTLHVERANDHPTSREPNASTTARTPEARSARVWRRGTPPLLLCHLPHPSRRPPIPLGSSRGFATSRSPLSALSSSGWSSPTSCKPPPLACVFSRGGYGHDGYDPVAGRGSDTALVEPVPLLRSSGSSGMGPKLARKGLRTNTFTWGPRGLGA